jgi:hypothetical protein
LGPGTRNCAFEEIEKEKGITMRKGRTTRIARWKKKKRKEIRRKSNRSDFTFPLW